MDSGSWELRSEGPTQLGRTQIKRRGVELSHGNGIVYAR